MVSWRMRLTFLFVPLILLVHGCGAGGTSGGTSGDAQTPTTTTGQNAVTFRVVDTAQTDCYDDYGNVITTPLNYDLYYGQDAQHQGALPSYQDNADGTVTDLDTGLMWQMTPDLENKLGWVEAQAYAEALEVGGYGDWRLPSIKELYSLIAFYGCSTSQPPVPSLDTNYFAFAWGGEGERLIDAQYWSSNEYVGLAGVGRDQTVFGVNFADGRIKGYPVTLRGTPMNQFVRCVRGPAGYGENDYVDNGDGTITDQATGLMWMQSDSAVQTNWLQALDYSENLEFAGYTDWRLPNAKELQSIVDYTRAPAALDPKAIGPAIDPIFQVSDTESWYWTSTTHLDGGGSRAVYVCFGRAFGIYDGVRVDVHGAGAQRSDPKSGDPLDPMWVNGFGPQNDEVRILNYTRCVRDAGL